MFDIVDTIRYAKDDPKITGLVLSLREMPETNLTKSHAISRKSAERVQNIW
ncbi:hypothetical protein P4S64_07255 [Vibrio sp. M60_M31a]